MTLRPGDVVTIGLPFAILLVCASGPLAQTGPAAARDRASSPRPAHMQSHYADAVRVHDAIVRGDLPGAQEAARHLASRTEAGMPEKAASYAAAMQQAATQVGQAADVARAGASVAAMLSTCGECHRAAGAMPTVSVRPQPNVGETVGHMLDHQRAAEQLMQGLVVPSSTSWNEGAQTLRTAPLARGKLPRDPKLTPELLAGERRLHELADSAAGASSVTDRTALYGEMLGTCASCHSLHPNVWGPGKR